MRLDKIKNRLCGQKLALAKAKVIQPEAGKIGHLVDWNSTKHCKVFVRYELVGMVRLPIFETWLKSETELVTPVQDSANA